MLEVPKGNTWKTRLLAEFGASGGLFGVLRGTSSGVWDLVLVGACTD